MTYEDVKRIRKNPNAEIKGIEEIIELQILIDNAIEKAISEENVKCRIFNQLATIQTNDIEYKTKVYEIIQGA